MQSAVMLSFNMLIVVLLTVAVMSDIMTSVFILSVILLNAVAPLIFLHNYC